MSESPSGRAGAIGADGRWSSLHLHLPHLHSDGGLWGAAGDRLVLEVAAPLYRGLRRRGWVERHFFIRYNDPSPHLRLRLLRSPGITPVALRARVEEDAGRLGVRRDSLRWVPYEPELERYGGPRGVALAEEIFSASSLLAYRLLRKLAAGPTGAGERSGRLGKGLPALLAAVHAFGLDRHRAARLFQGYGTAYLRQGVPDGETAGSLERSFTAAINRQADHAAAVVDVCWEALETGSGLPPSLARFHRRLEGVAGRLQRLQRRHGLAGREGLAWRPALSTLLFSYVHMTHNRLGVQVAEEFYLARLAAHGLGDDLGIAGEGGNAA